MDSGRIKVSRLLLLLAIIGLTITTGCKNKKTTQTSEVPVSAMPMYVIERDIPGAGKMNAHQLKEISQKSCDVLKEMGSDIEWDHSYVAEDKLYCVYRAKDSSLIRKHAELGGFPANKITYAGTIITPKTAQMEIKE